MSNPAQVDPIRLLAHGWRRLGVGLFVGVLGATIYAFTAPKWYQSHLSILPGTPSRGSLASAAAAAFPIDLPSEILGGGASDTERIVAVLSSVSVSDPVILKLDLMKRYELEHIEHARKALWEHCGVRSERKSGLVTLTCEDTEPRMAQAMLEQFAEVGNLAFRRVSRSSASEERRFLEERVAQARKDVDEASTKLREYQEANRVVDIVEQSKAVIGVLASLKADLIAKEIQLGYLQRYSSADEITVRQLREQISLTQAKLKTLEEPAADSDGATGKPATSHAGVTSDIFPPAMAVPKLRFELERLIRDQKMYEVILVALTQRYEMAKVNEARDTSTFQVLDHPDLPTYKVRPGRLQILLVGAIIGALIGATWVLLPPWWRARV